MAQEFAAGDVVLHMIDPDTKMVVLGYTEDGKVRCRWKDGNEFREGEFVEAELKKWTSPPLVLPTMGYGRKPF